MTDTIPTTKTLPGISPAGRGAFSNAVAWTLADLAGRTNPLGLPAAAPRFLPLFLLVRGFGKCHRWSRARATAPADYLRREMGHHHPRLGSPPIA
jgi:hypothetical protein